MAKRMISKKPNGAFLQHYIIDSGETVDILCSDAVRFGYDKDVDYKVSYDPIDNALREDFDIESSNSFTLSREIKQSFIDNYTFPLTFDRDNNYYIDSNDNIVESFPVWAKIRRYMIFPETLEVSNGICTATFQSDFTTRYPHDTINIYYYVEPVFITDPYSSGYYDPAPNAFRVTGLSDNTKVWLIS